MWRTFAALLLALLVLVLGTSAYLGTRHGRARLSRAVVADLDRAIPGAVSVHELERFSLTEIVLAGVGLRAPAGNEVLRIRRARARLAPWSLLRGRVVVSELSLEEGVLDLRFGDARRSLSSALIEPHAPAAAEGGPALALVIEVARLDRWRVRLPQGAGPRDVAIATSTLHVEAGAELRLDVEPTQVRLLEHERDLGALRVRAGFRSRDVSRLALDGELLGMQLALDLTLGEPTHPVSSWQTLPFVLELRASELTEGRLRRLAARPLPWPALAGSYAAQLSLRGVPEAFDGSGTVLTPAGPMRLEARARDLSQLSLSVRTDRLALRGLTPSLPDWRVTSDIALGVQRERDGPARLRIESSASMRVDEQPLPPLTLRAERGGAGAWRLELGLHDRWVSLAAQSSWASDGTGRTRARGWISSGEALALVNALGLPQRWGLPADSLRVDAQGRLDTSLELSWGRSGALQARATLGARALELAGSRLEQLAVELALAGTLAGPRVRADGHWRAAPRGSRDWTPGRLKVRGGPGRHRFQLSSGSLGFGSLAASGWHQRENGAQRLELSAHGRYGTAPWRVAIHEARLLDTGQLSLPRVELELCEQRFALHGRSAGADSRLVLELADVDLHRLLEPFDTASPLDGTLSGRVEARGDPARPELQLSLRATRLGLGRHATLDARLDGELDTRRGHFQLRASARESAPSPARSKPRLDLALDASGSIQPGASWPRAVRAGAQRAHLEVARLDSAILAELTGATLPASFDVHGAIDIDAQRGVPSLAYDVAGRVDGLASGAPTRGATAAGTARSRSSRVKHSFRYRDGRAATDLSLSDGLGAWLELHAELDSSGEHPPSLVELVRRSRGDWLRQLATAAWRVDADLQPRSLDELPGPAWLRRVSGSALGGRLVARRDRDGPPSGELSVDIAGAAQLTDSPARPPGAARCSSSPLTTRAELRLDDSRVELQVTASDRGVPKLHLGSSGELDVAAWLRGHAPVPPRLDVSAEATALPLERLPFVCERLRGELTAQVRARDVFGAAEASGDIGITRFSLGSDQTADVSARLALGAERFDLAGKVLASGRPSSFHVRAPRPSAAAGGSPAPREAWFELAGLPLAPFVPVDGPISHASGQVSGSLRASAGGGGPRLSGELRLDGVGLTVTDFAQPLSDIDGELSLDQGVLTLKRLSARDGDGRLELSGTLKLASARSFDARLQLTARKFPLRQGGEIAAQTTATAKVDAAWRPERNQLRVALEDFDTWLERREPSRGMPLAPHPDLRVTPEPAAEQEATGGRTEPSEPTPGQRAPLRVQIDAPQQFWVKRADFALELSANLDIDVEPAARRDERPSVSVKGQLRFNRGYMEMMGKTFEVKQGGLLRFTGGTSAVLDLTASYRDRRSNQLVVVHLQGSVAAPKLDFSVDGEKVSAGEAFQAIYGSNETGEDDVEPEAQASQILSALMAGVLTTSIRRKLGSMAPILSVDPADEDSGEQLRAGFELDALIPGFLRSVVTGAYVEGSVSSEKQSQEGGAKDVQTGVLIELYFPYNLVSSGRYGPDATWSFDVGWQPRGR